MTCCPFSTLWSCDLTPSCSASAGRLIGCERDTTGCRPPYREEDDAGGLHGVLRGEHDPAVVNPAVEIGIRRAAHGEVPLKEVVLQEKMVKYQLLRLLQHKNSGQISYRFWQVLALLDRFSLQANQIHFLLRSHIMQKRTLLMFPHNNPCLMLVSQLPRIKKSPSSASFACSTFHKECAKTHGSGQWPFVMSQRASLPLPA